MQLPPIAPPQSPPLTFVRTIPSLIHSSELLQMPWLFSTPVLPVLDASDLASSEKTRAALFKLGDPPHDTLALVALWDENRLSIEHEMRHHLDSDSNSPLLQELLSHLVWHTSFFCDEVDNLKAWSPDAPTLKPGA